MELRIDQEVVANARRLAGAIVDPIEEFIGRHSTLSVERAVARLCGVDGVDADGVPLPNRLVDALPAREAGVAPGGNRSSSTLRSRRRASIRALAASTYGRSAARRAFCGV
ncbi:MAG: hypothetical protein JO103_12390, partial [Candidatus Eremiobacteraeota bacterium]|nr:hypothetical protein [Candidatus Eremiobacteraeota bacterium]